MCFGQTVTVLSHHCGRLGAEIHSTNTFPNTIVTLQVITAGFRPTSRQVLTKQLGTIPAWTGANVLSFKLALEHEGHWSLTYDKYELLGISNSPRTVQQRVQVMVKI